MKRFSRLMVAALALSGCVEPQWYKPNATAEQLQTDFYACDYEWRQKSFLGIPAVAATGGKLQLDHERACMTAKGWMEVKK